MILHAIHYGAVIGSPVAQRLLQAIVDLGADVNAASKEKI